MRRSSALTPFIIASLVVASMTGCLPSDPAPVPTVEATLEPLFASDEEALAAAEEAYASYVAAVDAALATYDIEGLPGVAEGAALTAATESVDEFRIEGLKQIGLSTFDFTTLAQSSIEGDGEAFVQMYACFDVSGTDVTDESGQSIVAVDRRSRYPVLISLLVPPKAAVLLVSEVEVWDGQDFC